VVASRSCYDLGYTPPNPCVSLRLWLRLLPLITYCGDCCRSGGGGGSRAYTSGTWPKKFGDRSVRPKNRGLFVTKQPGTQLPRDASSQGPISLRGCKVPGFNVYDHPSNRTGTCRRYTGDQHTCLAFL
jgi:hypothetical protein